MITSPVTPEQVDAWKALAAARRNELTANRISGSELNLFFKKKYGPVPGAPDGFAEVVRLSARDEGTPQPDIAVYTLDRDVFVGIDQISGFFHVECEKIEKAVPIWDDLFVTRGLNAADIENFVTAAQYLLLRDAAASAESGV